MLVRFMALLAGWRFAVVLLGLLVGSQLVMLGALAIPPGPDGLGSFAEDFRVWCFGYDPATGTYEWAYGALMFLEPLLVGAVIMAVYWNPLCDAWRTQRRAMLPWASSGLFAVALGVTGLACIDVADNTTELPFPAESLRTQHQAPVFRLTDQEGATWGLDDDRGRVVVLTSIYATCGHTCPLILQQAQRALATLPADVQQQVTVAAITMDPQNDTVEVLANLAAMQQLRAPAWRLLTGESVVIEPLLDSMNVARQRNPETGVIEHANLFLVIDRTGTLAYRFALGERQERWLAQAIELLVREGVTPDDQAAPDQAAPDEDKG